MINYDKQFNNKINRVVRNFNAKVRRLEREGLKYIPDQVSVADLKSTYFDRDSLKRRLRQLERFSERGAEDIVQMSRGARATKWQIETLKSDMAYLKRQYGREIVRYGNIIPTSMGKPQAVSYARMGDPKYENLKILKKGLEKDITMMEQGDFNRFSKKVSSQIRRKERQKYILFANYFTFLEDVAYKAGIDEELLNSVKDKLYKMDIDKFVEFFETEKAFSSIIEYYDIQKLKSSGYDKKDIKTVQDMFDSINQIADEYL